MAFVGQRRRRCSTRARQRGAKRQCGGRSIRLGTLPGMAVSSSCSCAEDRDRADEALRVRVPRLLEQAGHVGLLDDLAGVHDGHPVAHLGDHAEVVRDEDERRVRLALEDAHEVEDLGLDRDVEGGGRLVGDEQLGLAGQRHGDHDALRHAAGELVRERLDAPLRIGDADHARAAPSARRRASRRFMPRWSSSTSPSCMPTS